MRRARVPLFLMLIVLPLVALVVFIVTRNTSPSPGLPSSAGFTVGNVDAAFSQAVQAAESGDYPAALDIINQMIARFPEHAAEGHTLRAGIFAFMGDHEQGIAAANDAIRIDASWLPAYYVRGTILLEQNEYDEALADFDVYSHR